MSLLLDALRKSEAQRRRGRAPSIEPAPGVAGTSMRGPRRRRWPWLTALAVVVIAVAAAWPWLPELRERLVEREELAQTGDSSPPMPAAPGNESVAPGTAPGEAAPNGGARDAGGGATRDLSASGDRAPEESAAPAANPPPETAPRRVAAPPAEPVRSMPEAERVADARARRAGGPAGSAPPTPQESPAMSARPAPGSEPASEPQAEPAPEPAPESAPESAIDAIRPWELPQAQRLEFPELDLTVHFYAGEPADRFVLINGERYGEGDRIDSNLRVARIVRQGVVVTFGSYRVLLE
jgi:general secretion pathway protein B